MLDYLYNCFVSVKVTFWRTQCLHASRNTCWWWRMMINEIERTWEAVGFSVARQLYKLLLSWKRSWQGSVTGKQTFGSTFRWTLKSCVKGWCSQRNRIRILLHKSFMRIPWSVCWFFIPFIISSFLYIARCYTRTSLTLFMILHKFLRGK